MLGIARVLECAKTFWVVQSASNLSKGCLLALHRSCFAVLPELPCFAENCFRWTQINTHVFEDCDLMNVIPLLFHGDDADAHRRRSFCVCAISSPLAPPRSSWDNRALLFVADTGRMLPETYDTLDAFMVHSLCELQEGTFFDVDPYGRPWDRGVSGLIMGGLRAVLCGIKGDQKYLQRALKLRSSWNSERVCMYCHATSSGANLYTSFGPGAPHRNSLVSTEHFIESGCYPNPWVRLPGFHLELVLADWLHLVDLSLTPEVAASDSCFCVSASFDSCVWIGRCDIT